MTICRPITRRHSHAPTTIGPRIDCITDPQRLKFAGQIAMHDVPTAAEEARRCVKELGAVAVIGTPNPVNCQHLHDEVCEPLWDELERLDVPIGFHPTG